MLMDAIEQAAPAMDIVIACWALGMGRASFYCRRAWQRRVGPPCPPRRRPPPRSLDAATQQRVLDVLRSERFVDCASAQAYATLLAEGTYLCSYEPCTACLPSTTKWTSAASSADAQRGLTFDDDPYRSYGVCTEGRVVYKKDRKLRRHGFAR
jgi:hypothetical protein